MLELYLNHQINYLKVRRYKKFRLLIRSNYLIVNKDSLKTLILKEMYNSKIKVIIINFLLLKLLKTHSLNNMKVDNYHKMKVKNKHLNIFQI